MPRAKANRANLRSALSRPRPARALRDPMAEFDRLPADLRRWLAGAALPWSPRSAHRAYLRALAELQVPAAALSRLDALQAARLTRDTLTRDTLTRDNLNKPRPEAPLTPRSSY
ncbi:MAG: DUF6525 family protein [Rhodobacterales bacterium]